MGMTILWPRCISPSRTVKFIPVIKKGFRESGNNFLSSSYDFNKCSHHRISHGSVPACGFALDAASSYLPPRVLHLLTHLLGHEKIRHPQAESFFLVWTAARNCIAVRALGFVVFWVLLTMVLHKLTQVVYDLSEPSRVFHTCSDVTSPGLWPLTTSFSLFVYIIVLFLAMNGLHLPQVSSFGLEYLPGIIFQYQFLLWILICENWHTND